MKKIISQILLILLIITIGITSVFINQVNAASMIDVSISSAKEGENFTVKLVLNNEKIAGVNCNVEVVYSDGTKSTTGTKGETGIAWAKVDGTVYGDDFISFTAKKSGTATVKITGINVSDELSNTLEDGGSLEKTITIAPKVTQEKPSTNENQGGTTTQPNTNSTSNTNTSTNTNTTTNTNTSTNTNKVTNTTVEKPIENPKFKDVNEKVYALKNCNVRSSCSTEISSNKIGSLMKGQSVTRTGVEGTWSRIKFDGKVAYVATSLLTTEEPEEEKENTVIENKVDNTIINNTVLNNVIENNIIDNEISNEELLNQIEQEIGVLPEVGHNIATYMFIFISIFSLYIIMRIQYKSEE